jgi:hypothetical protein
VEEIRPEMRRGQRRSFGRTREVFGGEEMREEMGSGQRPCRPERHAGEFWATPAGLSCGALFELLYSAWLRALFKVKCTVPRCLIRANKQQKCLSGRLGREYLDSAGLPNTPLEFWKELATHLIKYYYQRDVDGA